MVNWNSKRQGKFREGHRVRIKRQKSVKHFRAGNMPITGVVIAVDENHYDGHWRRPVKIRFDDGRESWWRRGEIAHE